MTEEPKKSGRGGRREGAGRPKGDSKLYTFRVPGRGRGIGRRKAN